MEKNNTILKDTFGHQKRWIHWRREKTENGKFTKIPYRIDGKKAGSNRPTDWSTYAEATAVPHEGIGIQFGLKGTLLGIDLDHWLVNGVVKEEKQDLFKILADTANTYIERSPSGDGLHLFFLLTEPLDLLAHKNPDKDIEIYTAKRFFTVTECSYGDPLPVRTVTPQEALVVLETLGYPWAKTPTQERHISPSSEILTGDENIFEKMFNARNGAEIRKLWDGDLSSHNDDDSAADMALCAHLYFWTGGNPDQTERLWLSSPLGARKKTQQRKDYRDVTISKVVAGAKDVYKPPAPTKKEIVVEIESGPFLSLSDFLKKEYPPAQFVLDPFFESGAINMISAPPQNWKSWCVLDMAMAIAAGNEWTQFKTEQRGVLIVNEEDTEAALQQRLRLLVVDRSDIPLYFQVMTGYRITEDTAKNIITQCQEQKITVVMFDSLRAIHNANENDSTAMQGVMDHLKTFVRAGITVIFTHHHKKKNSLEKVPDAEATRGSTAINAAVSGHISIEEDKREHGTFIVVKHLKSKATQKLDPFEIEVKNDGEFISFEYCGDHQKDLSLTQRAEKEIYQLLKKTPDEWFPVDILIRHVEVSERIVRDAIRALERTGHIVAKTCRELRFGLDRGAPSKKMYCYSPVGEQVEIEFDTF